MYRRPGNQIENIAETHIQGRYTLPGRSGLLFWPSISKEGRYA